MEQPTKEAIINAYNIANESGAYSTCKVLKALYPNVDFSQKDNRPVTERIKTLDDAIAELGEDNPLVRRYSVFIDGDEADDSDVVAYYELCIIAAALNEGWEPQFVEGECRWYPWFRLYTQDEIDNMDDDEKNELVRFGGNASLGSLSGLDYSYSFSAFSSSYASYGSRLAVKSKDLSKYFGKQFIHIWKKFLIKG